MGLTIEERQKKAKNEANKIFYSNPTNREKHNKQMREYYQLNKAKLIKNAKKYKKENPEETKSRNKKYYEENKERLKKRARMLSRSKSKRTA